MTEQRVVTLKGKRDTYWPAWARADGLLVDLRLFPKYEKGPDPLVELKPELTFRPDALREAGIDEGLIELASQSEPQGFVLMPREVR